MAFPVLFSVASLGPAGTIAILAIPAPPSTRAAPAPFLAMIPLPLRSSTPGPGTLTGRLAVPRRLLKITLPMLNAFEGRAGAMLGAGAEPPVAGGGGGAPVPERDAVARLPGASLGTSRVADFSPADVGAKTTLITHSSPGFRPAK